MEKLPVEVEQIASTLPQEKGQEVLSALNTVFIGVSEMRSKLDAVEVKDHTDKAGMKMANTIRLGVRQTRLSAAKYCDMKRSEVQQKMAAYQTEDKLWLKAKQVMEILTKEIEEAARWKEETLERYEAEQKKLRDDQRLSVLKPYLEGELAEGFIFELSDRDFDELLDSYKQKFEAKKEAERKAEEERIAREKAEAEERERIRLENERL